MTKDYYKILGIPPAATLQEIKRSFRRLALQYHPDKNAGSAIAEAHFIEIQEAYKVLSDARQREAYNYKRWFNRVQKQPFASQPLTPDGVLKECTQVQQYVAAMNVFHINYDAVSHHIRQLLTARTIRLLQEYNKVTTNRAIITALLQAIEPLPQHYFTPIANLLDQLAGEDATAQTTIARARQQKKQQYVWHRYKWVLVLLITLAICWLMYWYGR